MKKIDVNDIIGKKIGRLTVISLHHTKPMKNGCFYYYYLQILIHIRYFVGEQYNVLLKFLLLKRFLEDARLSYAFQA